MAGLGCGRAGDGDPLLGRRSAITGTIAISGRVVGANGGGVAGITITLAGSGQGIRTTDAAGAYAFNQLAPGSYSLRPQLGGCAFTPDVVNLNSLTADAFQDFSATGTACAGAPNPDGGAGGGLPPPPAHAIGQFVLLSSGAIRIGDRDRLPAGAVGTRLASGNPFTLSVGHDDVIAGDLVGATVGLLDRTTAGNVSANQLSASAARVASRSAFAPPPSLPALGAFSPGTQAVSVASGATRVLAAGRYGAVTVAGTLQLAGGTYEMASLNVSAGAVLTAQAASVVRVAGALSAGDRATLSVGSGLGAGALHLVIGGQGTITIGGDARLTAIVLAPRAAVQGGDRLSLAGVIAAASIAAGNDGSYQLNGGLACSTAADCDDGNTCTQDACLDGFCANASLPNGAACDDGDACTQSDTCTAGVCGGANPVVCTASDQNHVAGTCDPSSGACSNPVKPGLTACDDAHPCFGLELCQGGVCVLPIFNFCNRRDQCHLDGVQDSTGVCRFSPMPDGTACTGGTCLQGRCTSGTSLEIDDAAGTALFNENVPFGITFTYSTADDALRPAFGPGRTVKFTPGDFPPGQQVVVYDIPYKFGDLTDSDVTSGQNPCLATHFRSLSAPSGQTVTATGVNVAHVVRYVDGVCRARVPMAPLMREMEAQVVAEMDHQIIVALTAHNLQEFRSIIGADFFQLAQPQFLASGTFSQMGFIYEGEFHIGPSTGVVDLPGGINISVDPSFTIGVRADGLFHLANIDQNVTISAGTPEVDNQVRDGIRGALGTLPFIEEVVNATLSPPVSQLAAALQLPGGSVDGSCTTPTPKAPSQECFDKVSAAIQRASTEAAQVANLILGPKNFVCDDSHQCRMHPVFQELNILPNDLELVLAPNLQNASDPLNEPLTRFFQLVGPVGLSQPVQLGGQSFTIQVECSIPPVSLSGGNITTILSEASGTDLDNGISCGSIATE